MNNLIVFVILSFLGSSKGNCHYKTVQSVEGEVFSYDSLSVNQCIYAGQTGMGAKVCSIDCNDSCSIEVTYKGHFINLEVKKIEFIEYKKYGKSISNDSVPTIHRILVFSENYNLVGFYKLDERWIDVTNIEERIIVLRSKSTNYDCLALDCKTILTENFPVSLNYKCSPEYEYSNIEFNYCK